MVNTNKINNLGKNSINILIKLFQKNKYKEAELLAINICKKFPNETISWKILGIIYLMSGRYNKALFANERALKLGSKTPDVLNNLAITLYNLGRYEEAIKSSKEALKIDKNFVQAYGSLADNSKAMKKYEDASFYLKKAILLNSQKVETYVSLADVLVKLDKSDDALAAYEKAINLDPNHLPAYINMAETLNNLGRFQEAIEVYNVAVRIKPDIALVYYNLANIYKKLNIIKDAITNFKKALEINPNFADAHYNLANTYSNMGEMYFAYLSYEKAIEINPKNPKFHSNKLLNLNYDPIFKAEFIFDQHMLFDKQFSYLNKNKRRKKNILEAKKNKLRIGYVSPDFRMHSVAYFFEALIKNHNKNIVETFCYYNNHIVDDTTKLLQKNSDNWRTIFNLDDKEVIKIIRDDKIDILVDLCGHMAGNRLLIFASKAAPIQITYLGYPNTTGLSAMDYRLTDKYTDPFNNSDLFYSEKLIKLNRCFLCYTVNDKYSVSKFFPVTKNNFITFGSFNSFKKINSNVIKVWSNILRCIPNSKLVLKNSETVSNSNFLIKKFIDQGVNEKNLKILSKTPNQHDHMNLYNSIDIALDTFPYNGTTTTFEALWMGVPVITLSGKNHISRVSSSILHYLNLTNLIAQSTSDYQKIAIKMHEQKEYLIQLKKKLRKQLKTSNLCDGKSFAQEVEKNFFKILNSSNTN